MTVPPDVRPAGENVPAGVRLELDGAIATVTLDRPEVLNAQTPAMWARLSEIDAALTGDVRVVVLRGEGRSFSAGLDLASAQEQLGALAVIPPDQAEDRIAGFQRAFSWLRRPDLITIAAVHGHAIGAGFQLALACDLRVMADTATFKMAEITLGLVPDLTGTKRLVELVGYARALEICATGRSIRAEEAERIGLAAVVVPAEELDAAARDLAAALLAGPRNAVIEIKALLLGASGRTYAEQELAERQAQVRRIRDLAGLGE
ncbi:enoyl-CoA hydratase/carnithine racemase [Allocatelliglobosispora scoriae]|uniref:Enoyl-CoA hydratase/carnithine racemase n=1 Tax=Allocatelliglobosispora scoriae TaxID=643052 RepID=A0A841C284_9ACTN|nr:enoyl-CoA hydratase/isomerase family protein [Allocatelliglobosispora scoriae]MBB5873080.1 enoyl-CoA hydratase/carnithine racemase [Allocatelliglobosispora scoriae]